MTRPTCSLLPQRVADHLENSFDCKQRAVRAVKYNNDGNYCITCGSDKSLKLWNPITGVQLKTYNGHGSEVIDACGSFDNCQIGSCSLDKTVVIFEVATGRVIRKYRGHAGSVNCVAFNGESTIIFSGSIDGTLRAWDCRSRSPEPIQIMSEAKDSVTSVKVFGHEILTGSADSNIRRYDLRVGQMLVDYIGQPVTSVSFTGDGQCILTSSLDSVLRLIDKGTGELLNEYSGHRNTEYKINSCMSNTDRHILSGSEDGAIYVWDLVDGKQIHKLEHKSKAVVHSLSYHPTECSLLSACENMIYLWKN